MMALILQVAVQLRHYGRAQLRGPLAGIALKGSIYRTNGGAWKCMQATNQCYDLWTQLFHVRDENSWQNVSSSPGLEELVQICVFKSSYLCNYKSQYNQTHQCSIPVTTLIDSEICRLRCWVFKSLSATLYELLKATMMNYTDCWASFFPFY